MKKKPLRSRQNRRSTNEEIEQDLLLFQAHIHDKIQEAIDSGQSIFDGNFWARISCVDVSKEFPQFSYKQVQRRIRRLAEEERIKRAKGLHINDLAYLYAKKSYAAENEGGNRRGKKAERIIGNFGSGEILAMDFSQLENSIFSQVTMYAASPCVPKSCGRKDDFLLCSEQILCPENSVLCPENLGVHPALAEFEEKVTPQAPPDLTEGTYILTRAPPGASYAVSINEVNRRQCLIECMQENLQDFPREEASRLSFASSGFSDANSADALDASDVGETLPLADGVGGEPQVRAEVERQALEGGKLSLSACCVADGLLQRLGTTTETAKPDCAGPIQARGTTTGSISLSECPKNEELGAYNRLSQEGLYHGSSEALKSQEELFPLKKWQEPYFTELKALGLDCSDRHIRILIRMASQKSEQFLADCVHHLKHCIEEAAKKGQRIRSRGAFFRNCVEGKQSLVSRTCVRNMQCAQNAAKAMKWHSLKITSKFVYCENLHVEIPTCIDSLEFTRQLQNLYRSNKNG